MKTEQKLITPAIAAAMLESNFDKNRKIKVKRVAQIAKDIINGDWVETHQSIAFDINGVLLDGQHRLTAIVQADMAVKLMVSTGLDPESYKNIDRGVTRSLADVLNKGSKEIGVYALAVRLILKSRDAATVANVERASDVLESFYDAVMLGNNRACRVMSSSPVILGAIVAVLLGDTTLEKANRNLKTLVGGDFELLAKSNILSWFYRKVSRGEVTTRDGTKLMVISMFIFADKKQHKVRVGNIDESRLTSAARARAALQAVTGINS